MRYATAEEIPVMNLQEQIKWFNDNTHELHSITQQPNGQFLYYAGFRLPNGEIHDHSVVLTRYEFTEMVYEMQFYRPDVFAKIKIPAGWLD